MKAGRRVREGCFQRQQNWEMGNDEKAGVGELECEQPGQGTGFGGGRGGRRS